MQQWSSPSPFQSLLVPPGQHPFHWVAFLSTWSGVVHCSQHPCCWAIRASGAEAQAGSPPDRAADLGISDWCRWREVLEGRTRWRETTEQKGLKTEKEIFISRHFRRFARGPYDLC